VGYRQENYDLARKVAAPLAREVRAAGNESSAVTVTSQRLILQETGTKPVHPIQLMARAYGIAEEQA